MFVEASRFVLDPRMIDVDCQAKNDMIPSLKATPENPVHHRDKRKQRRRAQSGYLDSTRYSQVENQKFRAVLSRDVIQHTALSV